MASNLERQPLLASTNGSSGVEEQVREQEVVSSRGGDLGLFFSLLAESIPVVLSYTLQNSIQTVCVLVTGRLGPHELSVAAFANMLAFVTGFIVALGGSTGLDTLGSQAFTGGRPSDLGIHFQRCLVHLWILFAPVFALWWWIEPILLALGQEVQLSKDVQTFLRILTIGAVPYIGFETTKKYLQCQGITSASTLVLFVVAPINAALHIFLIHYTSLGLMGSPVALSLTYWIMFILICLYATFSPARKRNQSWAGFDFAAIFDPRSSWQFLKLAIPGILMVGTEWAAFEIVALVAGTLGPVSLAAQSVIMTTDEILNTIPFGIGVAASTRVGNLLGAKSSVGARHAAHASALLSVILGTTVLIVLMATKDVFGRLYTDDVDVVRLVSKVMPFVASFQVADGLAGACGGVLRGQGRQHLGALFNLVAYYVIALPLGISLAKKTELGLQGLWIGQVVGLSIVGFGEYLVVWLRTDWELEVAKGAERNAAEAKRRERVLQRGTQ